MDFDFGGILYKPTIGDHLCVLLWLCVLLTFPLWFRVLLRLDSSDEATTVPVITTSRVWAPRKQQTATAGPSVRRRRLSDHRPWGQDLPLPHRVLPELTDAERTALYARLGVPKPIRATTAPVATTTSSSVSGNAATAPPPPPPPPPSLPPVSEAEKQRFFETFRLPPPRPAIRQQQIFVGPITAPINTTPSFAVPGTPALPAAQPPTPPPVAQAHAHPQHKTWGGAITAPAITTTASAAPGTPALPTATAPPPPPPPAAPLFYFSGGATTALAVTTTPVRAFGTALSRRQPTTSRRTANPRASTSSGPITLPELEISPTQNLSDFSRVFAFSKMKFWLDEIEDWRIDMNAFAKSKPGVSDTILWHNFTDGVDRKAAWRMVANNLSEILRYSREYKASHLPLPFDVVETGVKGIRMQRLVRDLQAGTKASACIAVHDAASCAKKILELFEKW